MSTVFNHAVYLVRPETVESLNRTWREFAPTRTWRTAEQRALPHEPCSVRCAKPVEFWITYNYISGRAGRITDARKLRCREHAAKFARQHCAAETLFAFHETPVGLPFAPWDQPSMPTKGVD